MIRNIAGGNFQCDLLEARRASAWKQVYCHSCSLAVLLLAACKLCWNFVLNVTADLHRNGLHRNGLHLLITMLMLAAVLKQLRLTFGSVLCPK